jgi:hypothetical protein
MRARTATLAAVALAIVALALAIAFGGTTASKPAEAEEAGTPGQPTLEIVSPRNGSRQASHAAAVKVRLGNFHLAPLHFGGEPQLGEGNIRFSLNRVPDCVDPVKLQHAIDSPLGSGRLIGRSFDYPRFSGPNGVLAARIGTVGSYSPATRPEIYYHNLKPGFYRLVVSLAQNSGATTPVHAVTNFQVLSTPGRGPGPCEDGKVPSAKAAGKLR